MSRYEYTPEMRRTAEKIKRILVGGCKDCGGTGYIPTGRAGSVYRCDCTIVFRLLKDFIKARIPQDYWPLGLNDLKIPLVYKKTVARYLKHLDVAVSRGMGLTFLGENGIGKTSLMTIIGKQAIARGHSVRYFTLPSYISAMMDDRTKELKDLSSAEILLIDELDKRYQREGSKFVQMKLDEVLRDFLSAGKVLILASNWNESQLDEFSHSLWSLLSRRNETVPMEGQDYSATLRADFWSRLDKEFDYKHPRILALAYRREGTLDVEG